MRGFGRGMRVAAVFALVLITVFISCSSKPKEKPNMPATAKKNKAADYTQSGNTFFNSSQFDQALQFYTMALKENISIDNEEGIAMSYNDIGKVYMAKGDIALAEDAYRTAFGIAEKLGKSLVVALCRINLGEIYLRKSEPDAALTELLKAMEFPEGTLPLNNQAVLYHNLGQAYKNLDDTQKALDYIGKALAINKELNKFQELANNYYAISSVYSKLGNYSEALKNAQSALENDKKVENSYGIAKDYTALGIISEKAGELEKSYDYFQKSYLIFKTLGLVPDMIKTAKRLEQTAAAQGSPAAAEEWAAVYKNLEQKSN